MTKLFRNSKQIFALVIAFAIIAVSLFTGVAINADAASATKNIVYWDGTSDTAPTKTDANGTIIIETAEQLAYIAKNGAAEGSKYKVADGIDAFIMQPENSVAATKDADNNGVVDVLEFTGYAETKAYFEDASLTDKVSWIYGGKEFSGEFDGNGVGIYGIYVNVGWTNGTVGLFSTVAHSATFKNLAVRNSYFAAGNRVGALFGSASLNGDNYVITVDTVEITNCYLKNTTEPNGVNDDVLYNRTGIINGAGGNRMSINNVIMYGNLATNTVDTVIEYAFKVKNTWTSNDVNHKYSNSIFIGAYPYDKASYNAYYADLYTNVYTDKDVTEGNYTYNENQMAQVAADSATGQAAKDAMPNLDWEKTWVVTNGYPELRKLHGEITLASKDDKTHTYTCEDCGVLGEFAHTYEVNEDGEYVCTVCDHACDHTGQKVTSSPATCTKQAGTYYECNICGYQDSEVVGTEPTGHVFEDGMTPEVPADCTNEGRKGWWHCTKCDGNFVAETEDEAKWIDISESYDNPETNPDLIIPADPDDGHVKGEDESGKIFVGYDENGHWYECSACDGRLDYDSNKIAEDEVVAHNYDGNGGCKECDWLCPEHDYELTGNIVTIGDCYTDREEEVKCNICQKKDVAVTKAAHKIVAVAEVAPTDKMEGTKAHYQCEACKAIYGDAEGKTTVTKASLVIAKTLPAGYGTVAPENVDTGTKSPATSDSIMSVAAVALLAGAAFVIARKAKKA